MKLESATPWLLESAVDSEPMQTIRLCDVRVDAVSLQVYCHSQEEVDHYWAMLSEGGDPAAQQCGWLKDKFGLSWQVVALALLEWLNDPDVGSVKRVTSVMLAMKKLDVAELRRAHAG